LDGLWRKSDTAPAYTRLLTSILLARPFVFFSRYVYRVAGMGAGIFNLSGGTGNHLNSAPRIILICKAKNPPYPFGFVPQNILAFGSSPFTQWGIYRLGAI